MPRMHFSDTDGSLRYQPIGITKNNVQNVEVIEGGETQGTHDDGSDVGDESDDNGDESNDDDEARTLTI